MSDALWNHLRIFGVVAGQRGLTRAAERLDLSQPAVSQSLKKLERALGHDLVRRGTRDFELTEMGEAVHAQVAAMQRAADAIAILTGRRETQLTIRIVSHVAIPLIDEACRLFHQRHPDTTLRIEVMRSHNIIAALRQTGQGVGICLLPEPLEDLDCLLISKGEWSLFCGVEHPFFGRDSVTQAELKTQPFVSFACAADGPGLEPMGPLSRQLGLGGNIRGISAHVEEVRRMIIAGVGLGILPRTAARAAQQAGQLWPLRVGDLQLGTHIYLLRPPASADQPALAFADLVAEILPLFPVG